MSAEANVCVDYPDTMYLKFLLLLRSLLGCSIVSNCDLNSKKFLVIFTEYTYLNLLMQLLLAISFKFWRKEESIVANYNLYLSKWSMYVLILFNFMYFCVRGISNVQHHLFLQNCIILHILYNITFTICLCLH